MTTKDLYTVVCLEESLESLQTLCKVKIGIIEVQSQELKGGFGFYVFFFLGGIGVGKTTVNYLFKHLVRFLEVQ